MLVGFLSAAIIAGTPLLFATLGEIFSEKAGHLNLGVEGMMYMGAIVGFIVGLNTHNPLLAMMGAVLSGGIGALLYAFLTVSLRVNQTVCGLTLTIFGEGFASFLGQRVMGSIVPGDIKSFFAARPIPGLSSIPYIGEILFKQDIFVYFGYITIIAATYYLFRTKKGLNLRAVGESAAAADASGINVTLYKYVHPFGRRFVRFRRCLYVSGDGSRLAGAYYLRTWLDCCCVGNLRFLEPSKGNAWRILVRRFIHFGFPLAEHGNPDFSILD